MKPASARLLCAFGFLLSTTAAEAQAWPIKPLRAIIPIGAGGPTDIVPRVVFEQLSPTLGQSIVVENRTGAGGTIGAAFVAKAAPDGYTMLANGSGHAIAPSLYPNLGYHPARDFAAVTPFCTSASVLVVSPRRGFKTVDDFVTAARARPGAMNFASVGVGSFTHLSAEHFLASAGLQSVHVPFKGGPAAIAEVIAGRIDFFFGPISLVAPQIREGTVTALAVNGAKRSAALPSIPTVAEAGFGKAAYPVWFGLFLPAKTPREIVNTLHRETQKVLQTANVRDRLEAMGCDAMPMTPAEFDAYVEKEIGLNAALIKAIGLKPE
ncbi:MAG: tripartite tricarboxylate transporter substrate binding protein [Xanthobacteraceae bacterium]|nr:tripartite tricarboxylate transporter substrate binding protein [Xanthobacteraceae bacterium]